MMPNTTVAHANLLLVCAIMALARTPGLASKGSCCRMHLTQQPGPCTVQEVSSAHADDDVTARLLQDWWKADTARAAAAARSARR